MTVNKINFSFLGSPVNPAAGHCDRVGVRHLHQPQGGGRTRFRYGAIGGFVTSPYVGDSYKDTAHGDVISP